MGNVSVESLLELAASLEERDSQLAAEVDQVDGLARRAEDIRERAGATAVRLAALPDEVTGAERHVVDSRAALTGAREEEDAARALVAELEGKRRKQDELEEAVRELTRAEERAHEAAARVERSVGSVSALHAEGDQRRSEADGLAAAAPEIAAAISLLPRVSDSGKSLPGRSLEELVEWGARARAALFVVRGTLVGERERIAIEANAVGAAALGEQPSGASVAQVKRLIEKELDT